ncbi:hypothetical protein HID58_075675, partial [Brassica napus]
RHSIDESSLDRRVLTRTTSLHLTDESSLRPTSPHFDRRVLTRPKSRHSTVLSSLGAEQRSLAVALLDLSRSLTRSHVVIRSTSPHSTVLSSLRSTSPHSPDESSLDRRVLTRPFCRHFDRRVIVSIRFKLSMRPSRNPTDESSSRLFTSLLTVLGSNTAELVSYLVMDI